MPHQVYKSFRDWCFNYRKLIWCVVAVVLELLFYGLVVVQGAIPKTLSQAMGDSDVQVIWVTTFGLIYVGENLAYYYVFGVKYQIVLQQIFTTRMVMWGISMYFAILTLAVRYNSPTNAHVPIALTFFATFMAADVLAQAQRIYVTVRICERGSLERKERIAVHVAEAATWIAVLALGVAFAANGDQDPVTEYFSFGVALLLGGYKCLD
jgi:hypothetical protein